MPRALTHFSPICLFGHSLMLRWRADGQLLSSARHRICPRALVDTVFSAVAVGMDDQESERVRRNEQVRRRIRGPGLVGNPTRLKRPSAKFLRTRNFPANPRSDDFLFFLGPCNGLSIPVQVDSSSLRTRRNPPLIINLTPAQSAV